MRIGVLALQGDWEAHLRVFARCGGDAVAVRTARELDGVQGLVIPGGESTAMLRLMEPEGLDRRIADRVAAGVPVLATCAGLILLARGVTPEQPSLGALDVDVVRNAYGRQVRSEVATVELSEDLGDPSRVDGVFIRAPRVARVGDGVEVMGRHGDDPVLLRQERIVAATYHPELGGDCRVHRLFLDLVEVVDG
jgi:pyridoxal 5'-phosphate synthase pdxT subunit